MFVHMRVDEGAQHTTVNYIQLAVFACVYNYTCLCIFCVDYENARSVMYAYIVCMRNIMYMFAYSTCIIINILCTFLHKTQGYSLQPGLCV